MRIYEVTSTFKASAPIDVDSLRAVPGESETRTLCPGGPLRSALVQLACNDKKRGAKARVFPNGTVVVTARNAELVAVAAKRFASLLGTGPLRRNNKAPRVARATAKVANAAAVFEALLDIELDHPIAADWRLTYDPRRCAALFMRSRDSAKVKMAASIYKSGVVLLTSTRSGEAPPTSKKLAAAFNDTLRSIVRLK